VNLVATFVVLLPFVIMSFLMAPVADGRKIRLFNRKS